MRVSGQLLCGVCLVGSAALLAQTPQAPAPTQKTADQVLADARAALGGEKLAAIKTFVVTGRTRKLQGNNLVPIEFEILCELPDKYVRKDEVPAQEGEPTSSGFNGAGLIQIPPPPKPTPPPAGAARPSGPPAGATPPVGAAGGPPAAGAAPPAAAGAGRPGAPPAGRAGGPPPGMAAPVTPIARAKQDFVRLTLGIFAQSFSSYPLTFTYFGVAEAPQGKADVLDVKGPDNFALRFLVNIESHLPVMVSWQAPPPSVVVLAPGQAKPANLAPGAVVVTSPAAPAATASQEEKDAYTKAVADLKRTTQATPIENRLYFLDYHDQNGIQFPGKLRRAVGPDTIEETTFDAPKLNTKIDPKKFEVVK